MNDDKKCLFFVSGKCTMDGWCKFADRADVKKCVNDGVLNYDILNKSVDRTYLIQNNIKGGQFA